MHALSGTNVAAGMPTLPAATSAAPAASTTHDTTGGEDLLAAMNPAMDAAFAVGRPTDASGAAGILATTGSYIKGANATIDKLDQGIERRHKQLADLQLTDPEAAQKMQTQIDLLQRLRDRIQLSIERVTETIAGTGDDAPGVTDKDREDQKLSRREELELLEQRRLILTGAPGAQLAAANVSMVADTYGAGRGAGAGGSAGGTA
jgi:hypothetical protein